jgi:hypothetical protein
MRPPLWRVDASIRTSSTKYTLIPHLATTLIGGR